MILLELCNFYSRLTTINDIEALLSEKKSLEQQINNSELSFDSRFTLSKKVYLIDDRIEEIRNLG